MRNRQAKGTTDETLLQLLKEEEKQFAEEAERCLVQVEDGVAKLCEYKDVAKAAVQLITERSSHVPPYTPEQATDGSWARHCYEEATVSVGELYGCITQLLGRVTQGLDTDTYVGRGVWRILDSYHPGQRFRFYPVKDRPKQRRARRRRRR